MQYEQFTSILAFKFNYYEMKKVTSGLTFQIIQPKIQMTAS